MKLPEAEREYILGWFDRIRYQKGLIMRNKIVRRTSLLSLILLVGCGGSKDEEEFKFYALKEASSQQLELTVEASGTVEAISSIEIKSKASGQILFLRCRNRRLR